MNHPRQSFRKTRLVGRYISGRPMDGIPRTDSRFLHAGTRALTRTGHASKWAMLPGWKRAAWRLGVPAATAGAFAGGVAAPVPTGVALSGAALAGAAYAGRRAYVSVRHYRYRRTVVRPLVAALSPVVEMAAADIMPRLVLPGPHADEGTGQVRVPLPDHYAGRAAQVADIARVVTQRVGGEWDTALQLRKSPFYVHLTPRPAPPASVTYAMVRDAVLATTQDKPVLGLGTRSETLHLDFTGEIAHLAASIGTGGGKSSFLRFLVAQFAHHGVRDFAVCDVKWVSLQGMEDVPGLRTYRDVEEIWDAIAVARAEMDRRYVDLLNNPGMTFPRKVLIFEEQNAFALETAIRWREVRPKDDKRAMAPVWNDIALLLLKARQVNMNIIGVYQRMSAEASGGGTYRDQYGLKLLSRFSPQAWDTLVGTRPRGLSSAIPGRAIAILGGLHRSVQLPYISVDDAMSLATSGPAVTTHVYVPTQQATGPDDRDVTDHEPRYGLAEAARQEWCTVSYDTLRQRASRGRQAGTWPAGRVVDGAERWTRAELLAALASRPDDRAPVN